MAADLLHATPRFLGFSVPGSPARPRQGRSHCAACSSLAAIRVPLSKSTDDKGPLERAPRFGHSRRRIGRQTMNPKKLFRFSIFSWCLYLSSCAEMPTTHRPITDAAVQQIVRGQTTGDQILALFGAPFRKLIPPGHQRETWEYTYFNPQTLDRRFLLEV